MRVISSLERLEIEADCQRVIYLAGAFVDGGDYGAFSGLFTAQGQLERPDGSVLSGQAEILAAYQGRPPHRMTLHVISNTRFAGVSENTCHATSLVTVWASDHRTETGPLGRAVEQPLVLGAFDDRFSHTPDGWRIERRQARFLMQAGGAVPKS